MASPNYSIKREFERAEQKSITKWPKMHPKMLSPFQSGWRRAKGKMWRWLLAISPIWQNQNISLLILRPENVGGIGFCLFSCRKRNSPHFWRNLSRQRIVSEILREYLHIFLMPTQKYSSIAHLIECASRKTASMRLLALSFFSIILPSPFWPTSLPNPQIQFFFVAK
jgi:hypothetical protein